MRLLAIVDHRGRSAPPIETSVFFFGIRKSRTRNQRPAKASRFRLPFRSSARFTSLPFGFLRETEDIRRIIVTLRAIEPFLYTREYEIDRIFESFPRYRCWIIQRSDKTFLLSRGCKLRGNQHDDKLSDLRTGASPGFLTRPQVSREFSPLAHGTRFSLAPLRAINN